MLSFMSPDCVVVGAGAAGVTTSRMLADHGVDHVVLEAGDVGHTWATQRWDSFRLNTPGFMNRVLGDVRADDYSTRDETVTLLAQQAAGLPVRTHTPVGAVTQNGDRLVVHTRDEELVARTVVVASGSKTRPLVPAQAENLDHDVASLHVADYRCPATLPEGGVLVVGGGQSGAQVAEDLALAGRRVCGSPPAASAVTGRTTGAASCSGGTSTRGTGRCAPMSSRTPRRGGSPRPYWPPTAATSACPRWTGSASRCSDG